MNDCILVGDVREKLKELPDESVHCVVTSPPYWGLRDYGEENQLGLEPTIDEYITNMTAIFREVRRVLRKDGTAWVNMGDGYGSNQGSGFDTNQDGGGRKTETMSPPVVHPTKPKDLIGQPWRLAFALQADGWYLRSDIIWAKPNPMPESVTDRPTKSHEHIFLLSKSERYWYDADAVREPHETDLPVVKKSGGGRGAAQLNGNDVGPDKYGSMGYAEGGRNKRDVWTVATRPYPDAHFATYPEDLIRPCILAGCPVGGTVLDPFLGSGTTGKVAHDEGRAFVGIELNPDYAALAERRIDALQGQLF